MYKDGGSCNKNSSRYGNVLLVDVLISFGSIFFSLTRTKMAGHDVITVVPDTAMLLYIVRVFGFVHIFFSLTCSYICTLPGYTER